MIVIHEGIKFKRFLGLKTTHLLLILMFAILTNLREKIAIFVTNCHTGNVVSFLNLRDSGQEIYDLEVLEIHKIVSEFKLPDYGVSKKLLTGPDGKYNFGVEQRLLDLSWPTRYNSRSVHQFFYSDELIPSTCTINLAKELVLYASCASNY